MEEMPYRRELDTVAPATAVATPVASAVVTTDWRDALALVSPFWGTGNFEKGAALVMEFAFETVGVHRLEARAAVRNGRGNGALRKIGAVQEGILRKSFLKNGEYLDQMLWTVLDEDWRAKAIWGGGKMILH
jgi:hypothetical protein